MRALDEYLPQTQEIVAVWEWGEVISLRTPQCKQKAFKNSLIAQQIFITVIIIKKTLMIGMLTSTPLTVQYWLAGNWANQKYMKYWGYLSELIIKVLCRLSKVYWNISQFNTVLSKQSSFTYTIFNQNRPFYKIIVVLSFGLRIHIISMRENCNTTTT